MASRKKGNPDHNLIRFFESAVQTIPEKGEVEFLIKFDTDDTARPSDELAEFPFDIRTFAYERGEGRHALHNDYCYLFAQRNIKSRFCCVIADDCFFTRVGFVSDVLKIKEEICFIGPKRPQIEEYAENWDRPEMINKWKLDVTSFPILTTRVIEITRNFGWHCNVDNWVTLLHLLFYRIYKKDLWMTIESFYKPTGEGKSGLSPTYNNMEIDYWRFPKNEYYFDLVKQQVKNLYLNMEFGGFIPSDSSHTEP
jgi:hypothetical protein